MNLLRANFRDDACLFLSTSGYTAKKKENSLIDLHYKKQYQKMSIDTILSRHRHIKVSIIYISIKWYFLLSGNYSGIIFLSLTCSVYLVSYKKHFFKYSLSFMMLAVYRGHYKYFWGIFIRAVLCFLRKFLVGLPQTGGGSVLFNAYNIWLFCFWLY